jgi:hypothetical protein
MGGSFSRNRAGARGSSAKLQMARYTVGPSTVPTREYANRCGTAYAQSWRARRRGGSARCAARPPGSNAKDKVRRAKCEVRRTWKSDS